MPENNKNQDQTSGAKENQKMNQDNQTQNASNQNEQDQNSQRGSKWSNYQTREMSDEGYSDQNLSGKE